MIQIAYIKNEIGYGTTDTLNILHTQFNDLD